MNGTQYEEFCRLFITHELGIPIEKIMSDNIPSAIRPGLDEYKNQIDLCWEYEDKLTRNFTIVNAKWRSSEKDKVDQPDVLLIQQVKQEIAANKAMIITNTDFTSGARKAAKNHGIALHIVCPDSEHAVLNLHPKDRETIQIQLRESFNNIKRPYTHVEVNKAIDSGENAIGQSSVPSKMGVHSKEMVQRPVHQRVPSGIQKVQGGQSNPRTGGGGGSIQKGPGPSKGSGGRFNRRK
ncbi:MAG: restriction endonuclease [Candidatus Poribacteria bacterium]|nr:restriction endonuclease [Candidatus Poribacteria bacterium]